MKRLSVGMLLGIFVAAAVVRTAPAQQSTTVASDASSGASVAASRLLAQPITLRLDRVSLRNALTAVATQGGIHLLFQYEVVDAYTTPVQVHVTRMPMGMVFERLLAGTVLKVVPVEGTRFTLVSNAGGIPSALAMGTITGRVTDARTKRPVAGVRVSLDGATDGVVTRDDGMYQLSGVSSGMHTITVKSLGYARQTRTVTVMDERPVVVDVTLDASVNTLEQVVVTGTVIPTERKAIPNAMTVITAKDIEQRGITRIADLFRGEVPGMIVLNGGAIGGVNRAFGGGLMFTRGATALSSNSVGTAFGTNTIKTYVDGVELAHPEDLYLIDPTSIERIEILTGPQASTIYGSNAINGVMQIFTKRATTPRPEVTLSLQNGWIQNNLSSALAPNHNDELQLRGVEGHVSYNVNGLWHSAGAWTPAVHATLWTGSGGARLELHPVVGRLTTDLSLRHTLAQNTVSGAYEETLTNAYSSGLYRNTTLANGESAPNLIKTFGQTTALTLGYQPTTWWSHEGTIGQDDSNADASWLAKGYSTVADSLIRVQISDVERRSVRYTTTLRASLTSLASATLTGGIEGSQTRTFGWNATSTTTAFTSLSPLSIGRSRWSHNRGALLQGQVGLAERLYVTYGVRAEFNKAIGDKAKFLPGRYGVAYSQEFGSITAKLRGSYGRSIRPPASPYKLGVLANDFTAKNYLIPVYGSYYTQLPNPELVPEYQQGGEGGLELYLGSRGSLIVTRYNQTVDGLIDQVPIADSVRSLMPNPVFFGNTCADLAALYGVETASIYCHSQDADGYAYLTQSEYLNIGSIRNQGWELQGTVNLGPFSTHGTYSWVKSRIIGITPKFRAQFAPQDYPQYQPGAPFQYLPEHTWAWGVSYTNATTTAGLTLHGSGQIATTVNDFTLQHLNRNLRLPQQQWNFGTDGPFLSLNQSYALADLNVSRRMGSRFEGMLRVQNLADKYQNDVNSIYPTAGRQTSLGLRIRL